MSIARPYPTAQTVGVEWRGRFGMSTAIAVRGAPV